MSDPLSDVLSPGDEALRSTMTHEPAQPNKAAPYLDPTTYWQAFQRFQHGGLSEAVPGFKERMPIPGLNALGGAFQTQAARDALTTANTGGLGVVRAMPRLESVLTVRPMSGRSADLPAMRVEGEHGQVLDLDISTPGTAQMFNSHVPKELRGKGLGVAMYKKAIDYATSQGRTFVSDASVSADARRIYSILARQGYKVIQNPQAVERDGGLSMVNIKGVKPAPVFEVRPAHTE